MFEIRFRKKAESQLKQISKRYRTGILLAIRDLKEDPFIGKPLTKDLTGKLSYRIGVYRIIYSVNKKDKVVKILSAGHRSTVYIVN